MSETSDTWWSGVIKDAFVEGVSEPLVAFRQLAALRAQVEELKQQLADAIPEDVMMRNYELAARVEELKRELTTWQECCARQDYELDDADKLAEQAEAKLAKVYAFIVELESAKIDGIRLLGEELRNRLAVARADPTELEGHGYVCPICGRLSQENAPCQYCARIP